MLSVACVATPFAFWQMRTILAAATLVAVAVAAATAATSVSCVAHYAINKYLTAFP